MNSLEGSHNASCGSYLSFPYSTHKTCQGCIYFPPDPICLLTEQDVLYLDVAYFFHYFGQFPLSSHKFAFVILSDGPYVASAPNKKSSRKYERVCLHTLYYFYMDCLAHQTGVKYQQLFTFFLYSLVKWTTSQQGNSGSCFDHSEVISSMTFSPTPHQTLLQVTHMEIIYLSTEHLCTTQYPEFLISFSVILLPLWLVLSRHHLTTMFVTFPLFGGGTG